MNLLCHKTAFGDMIHPHVKKGTWVKAGRCVIYVYRLSFDVCVVLRTILEELSILH